MRYVLVAVVVTVVAVWVLAPIVDALPNPFNAVSTAISQ